MADDLNTEIKIGADASGVEAGVGRAKRSLKDLGDSAARAGKDAGAGIGAIGAGGDKAAREVERATRNIQGQLQRAIASFESGEKGSRKFYESLASQRGADVNTLKPLLDQLDAYKGKSEAAAQASVKASSSFAGMGTAAGIAARAVAAIGIGVSVGEFVRMADASTNVASRLGLVTSSAAELASVQQRLFQVAQSSRVSFVDLVGTYAQVARSTKDLGVSQTALLGVIQTISQAVTISGGSAASAQAALTQLSQGFASGALRGEELNSILEQTPRLAQALADGLGVGVGKLRELGQAGALTSEAVLGALEKSAAGVASEFSKMAVTVEQSSTNAANSVLKLVGAFDKLFGITSVIGGSIQAISKGLDFLTKDVEKLGSQGPLREAAQEVLRLDEYAKNLRNGMKNGVFNPNAEAQLQRINAQLAEAKARFRELDQQISGGAGAYDNRPEDRRLAEGSREAKRQAKLAEDANSFRLNQSGVPESYLKDMAELIRLNQAGVITGKEYDAQLKAMQDTLLKKTGVTKGSAAAANQEQNAYESLISSIRAKIEADNLEIAGGAALTESQRIRIKLDQDLAAGRVKLSAQNERAVRLALEELKASEASALAFKTLAKANLDAAQSREKYLTSLSAGLDKIQADIAAQIEATERMGLSKEAIAELDAAKLEMLATDLELQAIKAMDRNLDQQTYDALKKQAQAYRELGIAKKGGAAKEAALDMEKANAEAAKKAQEDWERASEQINSTLTGALMRGFESGKGFAENLRQTVVNMFKTMVLRPVISAIINPVAGALTGAMGLSGAAQAAGGISTAMSGASFLGNAAGILGGAGTAAGYGASALFAGNGLGALSGGFGMLTGGGGLGMAAQGAGMIAGVLGPIALGIGALTAIIGKTKGETRTGGQFGVAFDGSVTNQRRGETYTIEGQQFDRDFTNGLQTALRDGLTYRLEGDPVAQEGAIKAAVSGTASGINGILKALGSEARLAGFSAGLETSGKGRGGVFAGGTFADGTAFGESGKGDNYEGTLFEKFSSTSPDFKQALSDFTLDLKQSTIQALQSVSDIPKSVQAMLANVDAEGLTDEAANALLESINAQIVGVGNLRKAFEAMDMPQFADLAFDSAAAIAALSGGFDALGQNLATYYDNFYSEAERAANTTQNITKALAGLGLAVPAGVDQFRALVDAQDLSTEAGQKTYATLLSVSGAFAAVTQAAAAAAKAERDLAASRQGALRSAFGGLAKSLADMRAGVGEADARVADARMGIWEGYNDAQQKVIDLEMQAADATRGFAQSLRGFVSDLTTGPASGMGLDARYQMLGQQFSATATRAGAGDQGARDSLTGVASAYLDAARSNARTSVDYARDAARVSAQLNKLATVAESDPLVQKYDAESLSIQQQIADAQIDVVKYLALMEATGTSTDLGIQTVDKTLAALRDEYVSAAQAQAGANLKLDVALAALDALGLTESLVNAVAANQTSSLSAALNITDEALASITGALGLTPENLAGIGQQFAVEIALLVGQTATDLAGTLSAALAFDPAAFDALRTVIGYDTASPDFTALETILGFDLDSGKFQALQTILGMSPEASAQLAEIMGGIGFTDATAAQAAALTAGVAFDGATAAQASALTAGLAFADVAREQIALIAAGVALTESAGAQVDGLNAGIGWNPASADGLRELLKGVTFDLSTVHRVDGLLSGLAFGAATAKQVANLINGLGFDAAAITQVEGMLAGLRLAPEASAQVDGLLAGLNISAVDRVSIERLLGGIGFTPDADAAIESGLGLQPGLLPVLGAALGLSDEARKAIAALSSMGTIDQTVRNAYAMVGRSGIGTDVSQIDQEGYDFWTKGLATGAVSMTDFTQKFLQSAAGAPDEALRAYIAPYMKKLGIPGFAVGTSYVPQDMVAQIHRGEEITPRPYVDAQAADRQQTNALLARLVQSNAELKAELAEIKRSSQTTATGMTGIVNKQVVIATEAA